MNVASIKKRLQKSLRWLRPRSQHLRLGVRGERAAEKFLKRQHYKILTRNYECSGGEIDLIARDGDTLVFVEVRTRSSDDPIRPAEIISPVKWSRVEKTARYFLMKKSLQHLPCRFDLVTVHIPDGKSPDIEHFPDAYQPRNR